MVIQGRWVITIRTHKQQTIPYSGTLGDLLTLLQDYMVIYPGVEVLLAPKVINGETVG